MINKLLLVVALCAAINVSCMEMFKRGDTCKIVAGPLKEVHDTVIIEGAARDTWSIDTVEAVIIKKELLIFPTVAIYVAHCVKTDNKLNLHTLSMDDLKEDHKGIFYCGHLKETGYGHCFHPTWLEKIEENVS